MLKEAGTTLGEMQSMPLSAWGDDSIIAGYQFFATLQLRTPLRVLRWNGVVHTDRNTPPPQVIEALWEGFWIVKTKTWKELSGVDLPEFEPSTVAADIGPVPNDDTYLQFLMAVRAILEDPGSIDERIQKLRKATWPPEWQNFMGRQGGVGEVIERFFPLFVNTIPKLTFETTSVLSRLNFDTPNKLAAAPDEILLAVKGIGAAKLRTMRNYCDGIIENRDDKRLDRVIR